MVRMKRIVWILFLCLTIGLFTQCQPQSNGVQRARIAGLSESFRQLPPGVRIMPARFGGAGQYRQGKPQRMQLAVFQKIPGIFTWQMHVPAGKPELRLRVGFFCPESSASGIATAAVDVNAGGAIQALMRRQVFIRYAESNYVFSDERIDLAPYAGKQVTLRFRAETDERGLQDAELVWADAVLTGVEDGGPPPVILICVDALRRDRVNPFNEAVDFTPNLAALSRDGVSYVNAVSQASWTLPSVSSVLTGLPPSLHGAGRRLVLAEKPTEQQVEELRARYGLISKRGEDYTGISYLDAGVPALPGLLRQRGYFTQAISGNAFISYDSRVISRFDNVIDMTIHGDVLAREAKNWLDHHRQERFFLYLHYMEPHEWRGHYYEYGGNDDHPAPVIARKAYDDMVAMGDQYVGDVLSHLKKIGLYDKSLIIFYADHGELLFETAMNYAGHGTELNNGLLQVPLIVKFPGNVAAGTRCDAPVALLDIFSTIAATAGVGVDDQRYRFGKSLRVSLDARDADDRQIVSEFMLFEDEKIALTSGAYRLVRDYDLGFECLFRTADDREVNMKEQADAGSILAMLSKSLDAYLEVAKKQGTVSRGMAVDKDEAGNLKHLGYLQ